MQLPFDYCISLISVTIYWTYAAGACGGVYTISDWQKHAVAVFTVSAIENSSAQLASPFFQSRVLANEISMPTFRVSILSSSM